MLKQCTGKPTFVRSLVCDVALFILVVASLYVGAYYYLSDRGIRFSRVEYVDVAFYYIPPQSTGHSEANWDCSLFFWPVEEGEGMIWKRMRSAVGPRGFDRWSERIVRRASDLLKPPAPKKGPQ